MTSYAFVLGNTPDLGVLEIESVLKASKIEFRSTRLSKEILEVLFSGKFQPDILMRKLGGTVKIAEKLGVSTDIKGYDFTTCFDKNLKKVDFGLSAYGQELDLIKISVETKKQLEKAGIKSRYVLPKNQTLSSVVVSKQKLTEIIIVNNGSGYNIYRTCEVQDFESWNFRDYKRPCVDPASGMLPPKVARMMVNFASKEKQGTILDPFCGVGTILSEALLLGFNVIGSDISQKSIEFTRKNLDWIKQVYKISNSYELYLENAQNISGKITKKPISAVVTEPYMGDPARIVGQDVFMGSVLATKDTIGKIIIDLEKLYIGSLKNWHEALEQGGLVVITIPSFNINGLEFCVKSPIDKVSELGYTLQEGPITYSRPQAVVKRNIYVLEKK